MVAVVCDVIHPYSRGGRELRYQLLLPWLTEHADVHVYTMHWWGGKKDYTNCGITYHAISPLLPLYTRNRRSVWQGLRFGLASLRLLGRRFDVLEADHIPYFQVFALRLVASIRQKPFVVTWHEVWSRSYWLEYLGWTGWLAWSMERLATRLPDRIIAASPQTAERLQRLVGGRTSITTVPNAVDLNAIRSTFPADKRSDIVAVGRLIAHKRVDALLEVVALLHSRGLPVTCHIIGDGPERSSLVEQAQALGLSHAVEFSPDVSEQKELYGFIKAAKLFVSLSAREGFGIAVLEAIACGVPVLTTCAPDNFAQHLVTRYSRGVVCDPDPDAIAAAAAEVLGDKEDGPGVPATDPWVADYDPRAIARRLAGVYLQ